MRSTVILIVLLVSMGPAAGYAAEGKNAQTEASTAARTKPPQAADEKAVRSSATEFVQAFNKKDAKAIGALWTPNCEYVDETGRILRGRDEIEKEYADFFKDNPRLTMEVSVSSVKVIGGKAAIEEGSAIVKNAKGTIVSRGTYTAIHAKEGDKWLLASVRERAEPTLAKRPTLEDLDWLIGNWGASEGSKTLDMSFKWIAGKKFLELSYKARDMDGDLRSGVQIVGRNPSSGEIVSWSFDSTGGYGRGQWRLLKNGILIESQGRMADGAPTSATEIVSKTDGDAFTWKSVNRSVADQALGDSETLTVKRKKQ